MLGLKFVDGIRRANRDNAIDVYISDEHDDVLAEGEWQKWFAQKPEVLTREEKAAWIATQTGVTLGSDAFFPFGDNVERAKKSGVKYIAQRGAERRKVCCPAGRQHPRRQRDRDRGQVRHGHGLHAHEAVPPLTRDSLRARQLVGAGTNHPKATRIMRARPLASAPHSAPEKAVNY